MSKSDADAQESNVCPTCGESFADETGMKVHHNAAHGESLSKELVDCHWCGGSFYLTKWRRERAERYFCQKKCRAEWLEETVSGEDHPQHLGDEAVHECDYCGDSFRREPGEMRHNVHKFCSRDCFYGWASNNPRDETGLFGQDNDGKYGFRWSKKHKQSVRDRDGNECVICGKSGDEYEEKHGMKLDVHHIRPAKTFDEARERNAMSNLVTLCRSCHRQYEGIPLDLDHDR